MGQPVGTIFQVRFRGNVNNQQVMTVLNGVVVVPSSFSNPATEISQIRTDLAVGGVNDIITTYLAMMATNYTLTALDAQWVWPTRLVAQSTPLSSVGTGPSTCDAQNTHGTILFRTPIAGKKFRCTVKPPAIPKTFVLSGALTGGALTAFNNWGQLVILPWASGGGSGATYQFGIWHRKLGAGANFTAFSGSLAQASVRTQYRRTINVGR